MWSSRYSQTTQKVQQLKCSLTFTALLVYLYLLLKILSKVTWIEIFIYIKVICLSQIITSSRKDLRTLTSKILFFSADWLKFGLGVFSTQKWIKTEFFMLMLICFLLTDILLVKGVKAEKSYQFLKDLQEVTSSNRKMNGWNLYYYSILAIMKLLLRHTSEAFLYK